VISIDFANVFTRKCTGADSPDSDNEQSDYEKWVPHGYKDSKCLLGRRITYSRRKRDSVCLNGEVSILEGC
jgi:Sortilin, neurotensin receptor 3, C-terminal